MEGEIGGACSLHGMEEKCIEHFGLIMWREEKTRKTYAYMGE
jgi:hypothetical protein